MVAIDTNVLVRWLVRDDETLATKADQLLGNAKNASVLLDRIVLAELCYVLKSVYGYKKPDIARNIWALLNDGRFSVADRSLVEQMFSVFEAEAPLSPEDAWLLAQYQSGNATRIYTFDKALAKRAD